MSTPEQPQPPAGGDPLGTPPAAPPPPPAPPAAAPPPAAEQPAGLGGYEVKFPLGRVILLSIISLGLYCFYWFYQVRRQFNQQLSKEDNSALHTVGLIVPILNWFIIYWLWRDINNASRAAGAQGFDPMVYLLIAVIGGWFTLGIASLVIYIIVLQRLNEFWDVRTSGQAVDRPLKTAEIVISLVGALLFVLYIVLIIVVIAAGGSSSTDTSTTYYQLAPQVAALLPIGSGLILRQRKRL